MVDRTDAELAASLRANATTVGQLFPLRRDAIAAADRLEIPPPPFPTEPRARRAARYLAGFAAGVALMVSISALTGSDGVHCTHNMNGAKVCWWRG